MKRILQSKVFLSLFILVLFSKTSLCFGESLLSLQNVINWSCIGFKVVGPCFKSTPPYVGVKIRYWAPVILGETVKNPGDSVIDEFGSIVKSMTQEATTSLMSQMTGLAVPMTSGSIETGLDGSNLQFNEVHLYKFPFVDLFNAKLPMSCGSVSASPAPIIYLSELDALEWRTGFFEILSPKSAISSSLGPICATLKGHSRNLCMGYWGPVYPRRGFLTHHSEVVGAAANVYRAVSLSSLADLSFHKVLSPITFYPDADKDRIQLLFPHPSGCFDIGENPAWWESTKTSFNGKYLFVYWKHQECCVF